MPLNLMIFLAVLILCGSLEFLFPKRALTTSKLKRWWVNLALSTINSLIIRFALPFSIYKVALTYQREPSNIFWIIGAVVVLDGFIYFQHILFHRVPFLWRLHKVHHTDMDLDASSGIRFHTIEILLSYGLKYIIVVSLGIPAISVIWFEIILNAAAMFNHSNLRLPRFLDKVLRVFIVTPDMHRVHHSTIPREYNSNFGFNLSIWDKLFRTYKAQPEKGHYPISI